MIISVLVTNIDLEDQKITGDVTLAQGQFFDLASILSISQIALIPGLSPLIDRKIITCRIVDDVTGSYDVGNGIELQASLQAAIEGSFSLLGRASTVSIPNDVNQLAVTFSVPLAFLYGLAISIVNTVDSDPQVFGWTIVTQDGNGFTVLLSGNTDSVNYKLSYTVIKLT